MADLRNVILSARRLAGLASCALLLGVPALADTLPASVRACIGEADATRRLTCYDREVARAIAPPDTFTATAPPVAVPTPRAATVPAPVAPPLPATAAQSGPARHLTGKVTAVRQSGDELIVTLDDGTVWEQSVPGTSALNLRPGDAVKLDRAMGSWFLSNQYGDSIQVRARQP